MNHEPNRARPAETNAPRIVMQYFRGDTLVCELKTAATTLRLHVARGDADGNRENGWRIEAHGKVVENEVMIAACGPTRRAAFTEVCSKWSAQGYELGLPSVDWDGVAVALTAVRAID